MKNKLILILLTIVNSYVFGQKIDRDLPATYKEHIGRKEYQQLLTVTLQQLEGFEVLGVEEGTILFHIGNQPYKISMLPVVQECAVLDDEQKHIFIQDYVSSLVNAYYDQSALASADFSTVKKYLTLRLYPAEAFQKDELGKWVTRTDLEGTVTCVMLNLPTAFATVERSQLKQWGVEEKELFRLAEENSGKRSYEVHRKVLGENTELIALAGGSYAATAALVLEQIAPEPIGNYGAIVAIPHQEMVLMHNLEKEGPVSYKTFVEYLYEFVLEQYSQHTSPVSPDFYWYYQGKFTRLLIGEDQEGKLQIIPPMTSSQLVN